MSRCHFIEMKFLSFIVPFALIGCLHAEGPAAAPLISAEDIQRLLLDRDGKPNPLVKEFLNVSDTNQLFYLPTRDEPATPASRGFRFENVDFKSLDGTKLHGWFIPSPAKQPKGTVVFSHGNAGSVGYHLGFATWLVEAGYQVFMYDYRGFGKSGGEVDRRGMIEDVHAAFAYVISRKDVDAQRLVSYGHSMGGAKSVVALAERPVKGLRAVVIDGTFASYQAMAQIVAGEFGAKLITDEFAPKDSIGKISGASLLVIHGDRDLVVPIAQGKQLFDLAKKPKTFFEVKGGGHGDSLERNDGAYRKRMLEWLDEVM